jgi:hypothetical protein
MQTNNLAITIAIIIIIIIAIIIIIIIIKQELNWMSIYLHFLHFSIVTSICVNEIIILLFLLCILCYVILINPHLYLFACLFVYFLH